MSDDKSKEDKRIWTPLELKEALGFPINLRLSQQNYKYTEKKTLEFDPERIKPGDAIIVKVSKWDGLVNAFFAVMNVDGKQIIIKRLNL